MVQPIWAAWHRQSSVALIISQNSNAFNVWFSNDSSFWMSSYWIPTLFLVNSNIFFRSSYIPEQAYGNSKAAQILMTLYLNSMVHSYLFKCLIRNMNHFDWFCNSQGWDSPTLKLCYHWHFSNKNSPSRKNFLSWTSWISAQANRQDILWGHP